MGSGGMSWRKRRDARIAAAIRKRAQAALAASVSKGGAGPPIPIDIGPYRGWSIQQVEERLRTLDHEEIFFFNRRGEVVAAYRGAEGGVGWPPWLLGMSGATVSHGHPKRDGDFGGTLSILDTKNMLRSSWAQHRAVASGQGELNYILRRGRGARPKAFLEQLIRDEKRIIADMKSTARKAYDEERASGKPHLSALHIAMQKGVGKLHAWYKENAPKYGYEYVVRKKPYEY